ncbi:MAG: hypothetical protein KJO41_05750 [Bacteroidia bacterium]|nr:hypothetical protein [Bacteroidia bacterium]MBT8278487.1 hypothetical protein [Bacteroidia bacterium]NND26365.1 hypothetical protein [Flavobacteriaceae bacterium]NNK60232.1 hypothetical protein [Flavobacteriaceae bacterium]NNL31695.1 hypothetical protein [Flavobacteriaceae bacterium]
MKLDPVNYWEQIERLERLIRASELKAGLIFSFHGLILGFFIDRIEAFEDIFSNCWPFTFFVVIWIIFVLTSIYFAVKCFIPRIESKHSNNVFFFGDIVNEFGDMTNYSKELMDVCSDESRLYKQLGEQIYVESGIINHKFKSVKNSLKYLVISLVAMIPVIIFGAIHLL